MVVAFRCIIGATCPISAYGCAKAAVSIGGGCGTEGDGVWASAGTGPNCTVVKTNGGKGLVMRSKHSSVSGGGGALAMRVSLAVENGECIVTETTSIGSVDIDTGGTGVEVIRIDDDCGGCTFTLKNPQRNGSIKVTATVTGDCITCPSPPVVEDPCSGCDVVEGLTWKAEVSVTVALEDEDDGGDGGSGGDGGGCGNGRCGGENNSAGTAFIGNDSVNFRLHLGRADADMGAGDLKIYAETPSADLATPVVLTAPEGRPNVEVLELSGDIKQVKTPQGLVHVAVKDSYEYYLQCFYDTNLTRDAGGAYIKTNGFYGTNTTAYATWTIKNPDAGAPYDKLWISEARDGQTRTFKYTYTAASLRWDLVLPDGITTNSIWMVADPIDDSITNYFRELRRSGTLIRKTQKTYQFIGAPLNEKLLTQVVEGDGGVTRTTTYTNYPSSAPAGSRYKLQRVDYPDGNWVHYKYDHLGRVTNEFSAFGNSTPPALGYEPTWSSGCKLTEYAYSLDSTADGILDEGKVMPDVARRTIIKIGASGDFQEVSRTYRYVNGSFDNYGRWAGSTEIVQACPEPEARWGDAGNVTTLTTKNPDGTVSTITHPSGTVTSYTYTPDWPAAGYLATTEQRGSKYTTTVVDELGFIQSVTVVDSGVTLSEQTYNYKNSSGWYLDPLRRSYDVTDLAQRKTQYRYNECCGLNYVVDPDGVKTYQVHDPLLKWQLGTKQVVETISSVERTIQITNLLDAAGSALVTKRVGTNGSVITLQMNGYDVLGRVTRQTNALNHVTTNLYAISSSRLQDITVNPDGGTITNTYYRDGQLETTIGTSAHGIKYVHHVEQDGGEWRQYTKEIKLDASYAETSEWTKTYFDGSGQSYKTIFATNGTTYPSQRSYYNDYGQRWKQVDPDGVTTLFVFNNLGEVEYTILALDADTQAIASYSDLINGLDGLKAGTDRITRSERVAVAAAGAKPDLVQVNTYAWKDGESVGTLISRSETSADGLESWRATYPDAGTPVTSYSRMVYSAGGNRYLTNMSPDGSYTLSHYATGRLASVTHNSSDFPPNAVSKTSYGYDSHGRRNTVTDARNGTTTYALNDNDLITSVTTPVPGSGQFAQATLTYYDKMSRATNTLSADGGSVTNEYFPTGLLKKTYGSRTYPVEYTYDYAGRMKTMKTWQDFAVGSPATTTWNYDAYRGWLANKRYADSTGPDYTYTAGGRLKTRAWARIGTSSQRILTTYKYGFDDTVSDNQHGDLTETSYTYDPQSTPTVTTVYDRRGRPSTTTQGSTTTTLTYNDAGQSLVESYSGGTLDGLSVTNGFDTYLRRTNLTALNGSTVLARTTNSYDSAGRLSTVSDGDVYSITYGYLENSPLVGNVTFKQSSTTRMATTKSYDYLNRLTAISNAPISSGAVPVAYSYAYNSANQRTRRTEADGSYWSYEYDSLGQVKRGAKFFNDGHPVPGQQFEYVHDDIGNRKSTKAGGDENGLNLRLATYTPDNLNQYTSRTVPGAFDVLGLAMGNNSTPTVNSVAPWRKGEYFRKELSVNNGSAAVWGSVSVAATGETTVNGNVFVPQTPEAFTYDEDGNLTQDGRWDYLWDAENRLVKLRSRSGSPAPERRIEFQYDHQSRRIHKAAFNDRDDGQGSEVFDMLFLYDGWNLMAELDANASNGRVRTYLWGLDLSGSMQGAGGVGGLLEVVYYGTQTTNSFAAFDGNGNLAALVNAADGNAVAHYEYGPFGEVVRVTGTLAKANPFRFSTKYQDDESDFLYYGYRSYNPSTGRWFSRDPIGEKGGKNLRAFSRNNSVNNIDVLGLSINQVDTVFFTCSRVCGPDYTAAVNAEIAKFRTYLGSLPQFPAPNGTIGWPPSPDDNRDHENVRAFYQWFAQVALALNYDAQARSAAGSGSYLGGCPSIGCTGTITLCGKCVGSDVPGNVMFGFLAAASGVSDRVRDFLAHGAESTDGDGEGPMDEDVDVFPAGKDLFNSGSDDICTIMSKLPSHTSSRCAPCGVSAGFSKPRDFATEFPYPVYR